MESVCLSVQYHSSKLNEDQQTWEQDMWGHLHIYEERITLDLDSFDLSW